MKKLFLLTLLFTCYLINPEVIILGNGKIIDGKIIKMDEDTMTVITKNKEMVIDRDDVVQTFRSMNDYNNYKKSLENNKETTEKGSLIAEWLFNGNANDTSGNELHGTVFGSKKMVEDRFGNKDSAYEFGVGKTKGIRVDKNIYLLQPETFSISLWVKIEKYYDYARIIDFYKWHDKRGYTIMYSPEGYIYWENCLNNGTRVGVLTDKNLKNNVWYHIVYTYNKKTVKLYFNGLYKSQNKISSIVYTKQNEANFYIGNAGSNDPRSHQFYGCIDDIRFYDYALSEEEINGLYHENGWSK